jgi:hypothetical protein
VRVDLIVVVGSTYVIWVETLGLAPSQCNMNIEVKLDKLLCICYYERKKRRETSVTKAARLFLLLLYPLPPRPSIR